MNFGIARGMARLILDPYSPPEVVPEATAESGVVRWILDKARGSSPMSDSDSAVRTSLDREIAWSYRNRTVDRMSRVRKCTMSPLAAIALTVTIGPEAAIPAS